MLIELYVIQFQRNSNRLCLVLSKRKKTENENRYDKRMAFIYTYKGIERFTAVDLTYLDMLTTQLGKIFRRTNAYFWRESDREGHRDRKRRKPSKMLSSWFCLRFPSTPSTACRMKWSTGAVPGQAAYCRITTHRNYNDTWNELTRHSSVSSEIWVSTIKCYIIWNGHFYPEY